mgnify:CR=1 FL=1
MSWNQLPLVSFFVAVGDGDEVDDDDDDGDDDDDDDDDDGDDGDDGDGDDGLFVVLCSRLIAFFPAAGGLITQIFYHDAPLRVEP